MTDFIEEPTEEQKAEQVDEATATASIKPAEFGKYELILREPFRYAGREYVELHFDLTHLTGRDLMACEEELRQQEGRSVLAVSLDTSMLLMLATRGCEEKIGADGLKDLPLREVLLVRSMMRNFLPLLV